MKIISNDNRFLGENITLDEVLEIEGTLTLNPASNVTIITTKNIIVTGKLISKPNADVVHAIRFTNINENNFKGGGESVLDSDVGLWVIGNGQLDLFGAFENDWKRIGNDYVALQKFAESVGSNMQIEGTPNGQSHG